MYLQVIAEEGKAIAQHPRQAEPEPAFWKSRLNLQEQ